MTRLGPRLDRIEKMLGGLAKSGDDRAVIAERLIEVDKQLRGALDHDTALRLWDRHRELLGQLFAEQPPAPKQPVTADDVGSFRQLRDELADRHGVPRS